jgi:hypothetical protein
MKLPVRKRKAARRSEKEAKAVERLLPWWFSLVHGISLWLGGNGP